MERYKILKNSISLEKIELVNRIDCLMQVPRKRVYIYFDDQEYSEYDNSVEDYYKKDGFHRYTKDKTKIFGLHPPAIFKIMEKEDCDHFIWISKKVCDGEGIKFAWYYSHELQHLIHYIENPAFCNLSYFLCETYAGINGERYAFEVPIEFDCDQKAKMIVKEIFGETSCEQCITKLFAAEEYSKFKQIEALMPFDIKKETVNIICKHKELFLRYSHYIDKYGIDIEYMCSN